MNGLAEIITDRGDLGFVEKIMRALVRTRKAQARGDNESYRSQAQHLVREAGKV